MEQRRQVLLGGPRDRAAREDLDRLLDRGDLVPAELLARLEVRGLLLAGGREVGEVLGVVVAGGRGLLEVALGVAGRLQGLALGLGLLRARLGGGAQVSLEVLLEQLEGLPLARLVLLELGLLVLELRDELLGLRLLRARL